MFLTVRKKAATKADAQKLLTQSLTLRNPFGIPTILVEQEKIRRGIEVRSAFKKAVTDKPVFPRYWGSLPYGEEGHNLNRYYRDVFNDPARFPAEQGAKLYKMATRLLFDNDDLECIYIQDGFSEFSLVDRVRQHDGKIANPDEYQADQYIDPTSNIVVVAKHAVSGRRFLADLLMVPEKTVKPMPGDHEQLKFFGLWHEYAHGTGAGEPQADMMAALMYRKFFKDQALLPMISDTRFIASVLQYDCTMMRTNYYAMDEAIDFVIAMDQADIDAMSMDDIKAMRFKKFEKNEEAIVSAGSELEEAGVEAFNTCHLPLLEDLSKELAQKHAQSDDPTGGVLQRFHRATRRLNIGLPIYYARKMPTMNP